MATKLGNSLRKSLSAEKKTLNGKMVQQEMFPTTAKNNKRTNPKLAATTTKNKVKPNTKMAAEPTQNKEQASIKVKISPIAINTHKSTTKAKVATPKSLAPAKNTPKILSTPVAKTAVNSMNSFRNLHNPTQVITTVGEKLRSTYLDAFKLAHEDLREYLSSTPQAKNVFDLISLNLSYMAVLRKRRSDIIANSTMIYSEALFRR